MFDIIEITLENFRSYRGKHSLKLPLKSGLYNLTGNNLDEPALEENGAGKSSLLEAISWCLYGKTTRGLKATEVVTRGEKHCRVAVHLIVGPEHLTVRRTHNPNSLTVQDNQGKHTLDQASLQKRLRLTQESFAYSVLSPQFGSSFFDLQPAAKLMLFSQILELDFWLDKSREADVKAKELAEAKAHTEQIIARYEALLSATATDIKELKKRAEDFDADTKGAVQGLKANLAALVKQQGECTDKVSEYSAMIKSADKKLSYVSAQIDEAQQHAMTATTLEDRLAELRSQRERFAAIGPECPTCHQAVPHSHLKGRLKVLNDKISLVVDKLQGARTKAADKKQLEHDRTSLRQNKHDFERKKLQAESDLASVSAKARQLKANITERQEAENPYAALVKEKVQLRLDLRTKVAAQSKELDQVNEDYTAVNFWVTGFKRVRLFIVEETLRQLELEVNNNLASLGLVDWRIEFDVERENKAGGLTKGFVVLIYAPGSEQPVRWETFSGGETQRLRLAGDLGLANLIMERAGLVNQIELYDEPSEHLSRSGLLDLAETLDQRATDTGKRIWIVDHRLIEYPFTGKLVAIKDSNGSRLEFA